MLLRSSPLPTRSGYAFEPKWDGFRALVSTAAKPLVVRSRRRWDMSDLIPELAELPAARVYDGELIAFGDDGLPSFPACASECSRGIERSRSCSWRSILTEDGEPLLRLPYRERRGRLEALNLCGPHWCISIATDDGAGLWDWVRDRGLEGIVAKRLADPYRPGERRWLKIKNRDYWRYPLEVESALRRVGA